MAHFGLFQLVIGGFQSFTPLYFTLGNRIFEDPNDARQYFDYRGSEMNANICEPVCSEFPIYLQ